MIWDIDSYVIDAPGEVSVGNIATAREYPEEDDDTVDLEYRARVNAIYQQMLAKQHERWLRRKNNGTEG